MLLPLWDAVDLIARAAARTRVVRIRWAQLGPVTLDRLASRRRAIAAEVARLATAARLAGRHDE